MFKSTLLRQFRAVRHPHVEIFRYNPSVLRTAPFARYNSTYEKPSEIKNTLTSFDNPTVDGPVSNLTSDQWGYLDSIEMAQGWGPTAFIERLLESIHITTGLPWWGTIIATTVVIRLFMFPLYVKSSANAVKMAKVKPELDQVMADLRSAKNSQEQVKAAHKRKALMRENDIHMSHQLLPVLQLPIAYGFFQATRKMANYPVEGFPTQGYAWFHDLSQVDPYCGLQIIAAAVVILMVRRGGETGATAMNPAMKKIMTIVPIVSIFVTKELAAAVVLYFAANGIFSFFQTLVLRNKYFRKFANLPPIIRPTAAQVAAQPTTVREWWKDFNKNMNTSVEKKMLSTNAKLGSISKNKSNVSGGFIKRH